MNRTLLYLFIFCSVIYINDISATDLIFKRNSEAIYFSKNKPNLPIILDFFSSKNSIIENEKLIDGKKFSRREIENIKISPGKYIIELSIKGLKESSRYMLEVDEQDKEIFIEIFQSKHNKKYFKKYNSIQKNSDLIKTSSGHIRAIVSNHSKYGNSNLNTQPIKISSKSEKLPVEKNKNKEDPMQKLSELRDLHEAGLISEEVYSRLQKKYLEQIL